MSGDDVSDDEFAEQVMAFDRESKPKPCIALRDYFIAHAPADPQAWFDPVMRQCPAVPSLSFLTGAERQAVEEADDSGEGSQEAQDWLAYEAQAIKEQAVWQAEFRKERCVQWPAAWADEMLKARAL